MQDQVSQYCVAFIPNICNRKSLCIQVDLVMSAINFTFTGWAYIQLEIIISLNAEKRDLYPKLATKLSYLKCFVVCFYDR